MNPERWQRIKSLLEHVLELDETQRDEFLARECANDPKMRHEVTSLLSDDAAAKGFLQSVETAISTPKVGAPPGLAQPDQIGPYRLQQKLGEGGMGIVYLAEQTEPVRRQVALKVIKLGMDTADVVARFEAERQALAVMDHPSIARVFDGGATEGGRPFFVMELVRGVPISRYCDDQKLSVRRRLELFIPVCEAVQHAHQKGVIHRDLKPSNILVTAHSGDALPKVIDFGVAKATGASLTDKTLFTSAGQMIGTPEYMSPEQATMAGLDIDTRTDIYSLGIILYELLVGALPFDSKTLRGKSLGEMQRIIREDDPPRPSTKLTSIKGTSDKIAARRKTDPGALMRQLRGDLDWIVMKALEKDRTRRYETANGLAVDIRRFLNSEPIVARPPSTAYRAMKFVRRNRLAVALVSILTLVLIAGMVGTGVGMARAKGEERRAVAALDVLKEMLRKVDPNVARGEKITVRHALDALAESGFEEITDEPTVEAEVRATIGTMYGQLGLLDAATTHLRQAIDLYTETIGENHKRTIEARNFLAMVYFHQLRYEEAEAIWIDMIDLLPRTLGPENEKTLAAQHNFGAILLDTQRYSEAERLFVGVLEKRRRVLGEENRATTATMNNLAKLYKLTGRLEEAEPLYVAALDIRRRALGDDHERTLNSVFNLGNLYKEMGDLDRAEPLYREAFDGFTKIYDSENQRYDNALSAITELTDTLMAQGRLDEAESLAERSLRLHESRFAADDVRTVKSGRLLAGIYESRGRSTAAEELRLRFGAD